MICKVRMKLPLLKYIKLSNLTLLLTDLESSSYIDNSMNLIFKPLNKKLMWAIIGILL